MANLCLTTACNRACGYCFARRGPARSGSRSAMDLGELDRLMGFLERSGIDQVRLLGGEPTLHPRFPEILRRSLDRGFRVLVFSNGLIPEDGVAALARAPAERTAVLVNASRLDELSPRRRRRFGEVLDRLGSRVTLGLTLDSAAVVPDYLLELIDRHHLARWVRLGLAHPRLGGANAFLQPRSYPAAGRRIAAFARRARERGVRLELDCGFVPCMFPAGSLEALGPSGAELGRRCGPVPDLLPGGEAVPCFPLASLARRPVERYRDAARLRRSFEAELAPFRRAGVYRRCGGCALASDGRCRGGCLAAALNRLSPRPPVRPLTPPLPGDTTHGQRTR